MDGNELFEFNGQSTGYSIVDFWRFQYSNIYSLHGEIAEFIIARALGISEAHNSAYWTLWDITYRNIKIEVKATAYYHLWNEGKAVSNQRMFSIAKANGSYDPSVCGNEELCRQNDIYVFCLNTGTTQESSNPLNLNNWEFYIVPTSFLNEHCGDNKKISLGRIKSFGFTAKSYAQIKAEVDRLIDAM